MSGSLDGWLSGANTLSARKKGDKNGGRRDGSSRDDGTREHGIARENQTRRSPNEVYATNDGSSRSSTSSAANPRASAFAGTAQGGKNPLSAATTTTTAAAAAAAATPSNPDELYDAEGDAAMNDASANLDDKSDKRNKSPGNWLSSRGGGNGRGRGGRGGRGGRTPANDAEGRALEAKRVAGVMEQFRREFDGVFSDYQDSWDNHHVRLPCSPWNAYRRAGDAAPKPKWVLIDAVLSKRIEDGKGLEAAILASNERYAGKWDFRGLHATISGLMSSEDRIKLFGKTIPGMQALGRRLPALVPRPIPLLRKGENAEVTLGQEAVACLLVHAFFCTFPRRNDSRSREYADYPSINFSTLYAGWDTSRLEANKNKIRTVLNYFEQVVDAIDAGQRDHVLRGELVWRRVSLGQDAFPDWSGADATLGSLDMKTEGTIEGDAPGWIHGDFANRVLGGGVLSRGCVQEEIRFLISTELIVGRLFTAELGAREVILMTGARQWTQYEGYGKSFVWSGAYDDPTPWGDGGDAPRLQSWIVAFDALPFADPAAQFQAPALRRELNKAYVGFMRVSGPSDSCGIATGNWGCGAFNGDRQTKWLIQLIAAAVTQRALLYFTFGDRRLTEQGSALHMALVEAGITAGRLWDALLEYGEEVRGGKATGDGDLFTWLWLHVLGITMVLEGATVDDSSLESIVLDETLPEKDVPMTETATSGVEEGDEGAQGKKSHDSQEEEEEGEVLVETIPDSVESI